MRIYLTTRSIPELASLPDLKREEVWQRCHPKAWRHWQTWMAFLIMVALWGLGFYVAVYQDADFFSWSKFLAGFLILAIGQVVFFTLLADVTRRYIREELSK